MQPLTTSKAIVQFIEKYGIPPEQRNQALLDLGTICVLFSTELQNSPR
jgi:hypothetical protein